VSSVTPVLQVVFGNWFGMTPACACETCLNYNALILVLKAGGGLEGHSDLDRFFRGYLSGLRFIGLHTQ